MKITLSESVSYLEYLEGQFDQTATESGRSDYSTERVGRYEALQSSLEEWKVAAATITPRSKVGELFGVTLRDLNSAASILSGAPRLQRPLRQVKRLLDATVSLTATFLLAPILLIIALSIKLCDRGPILSSQDRVGLNGVPFKMLKFRTMVADADPLLASLADGPRSNGVLFKMTRDPRITRPGRFLRQTSLDELPQLFNVLRGEMSLVGPRPPLVDEVQRYDDYAGRHLHVTPGITGLWQVSGRPSLSWDEAIRLDIYYVENWSIAGDLAILAKTIRAVLRQRDSY